MRAKLTITKNAAGEVYSAVVTFTTDAGNDGKMVSLAFDKRPVVAKESQGWSREEFTEYTGTPVMTGEGDLRILEELGAALVEVGGALEFAQPVETEPYGV